VSDKDCYLIQRKCALPFVLEYRYIRQWIGVPTWLLYGVRKKSLDRNVGNWGGPRLVSSPRQHSLQAAPFFLDTKHHWLHSYSTALIAHQQHFYSSQKLRVGLKACRFESIGKIQKKPCSNNTDAFKIVHGMLGKMESCWCRLNSRGNYCEGLFSKVYLVLTVFCLIRELFERA
jgi:hypothetical protein